MPLTVLDEITAVLVERLETLKNGVEDTVVTEVIQPTRLGTWTPRDSQIVVVQANPELVPELMCPGNPPAEAWRQTFNLCLHIKPSESDTEAADPKLNRFVADVRKVVCDPAATWHNFGGWSIDATWQTMENIDSGEGIDGVNMPLAITYRTDEGNPYNVRA
jgi:hypothetical protein